MSKKDTVKLSASRIKTLLSCSWIYYCKYVLKLYREGNDGQRRGLVCHSILEYLLKPKRHDLYKKILKEKTIQKTPLLVKYVKLKMKNVGITTKLDNKDVNNFDLIDEMILTGLKYDFLCEKKGKPNKLHGEMEFEYEHEEDGQVVYTIKGFIDKVAEFDDRVEIYDYKTSKEKFTNKELGQEYQAMIYALYARRVLRAKSVVNFLFLRYNNTQPKQAVKTDDFKLSGFEEYLKYLTSYLKDFDMEKGKSNFAYDVGYLDSGEGFKGRALCGRSKYEGQLKKDGNEMWSCDFKWPREYYALTVSDKVVETFKTREEAEIAKKRLRNDKENLNIEKRRYNGCPKFNRISFAKTIGPEVSKDANSKTTG
jgi:hypothetical protein